MHNCSIILLLIALIACLVTGCATPEPKPEEIASLLAGTYGVRLPGETGASRILHLSLSRDHQAVMKTLSHKGSISLTETGQWEVQPDGSIILLLTAKEGRRYDKPVIIVLVLQAKGLEARAYDRDVWGAGEIVFERQPEISGIVWYLQEIRYIDGRIIRPDDPANYSLAPAEDGTVAVRSDCNEGKGNYILSGASISFRNMAFTRAACAAGSYSNQYIRALDAAATCMHEDGYLSISMDMNSGVMRFVRGRITQ